MATTDTSFLYDYFTWEMWILSTDTLLFSILMFVITFGERRWQVGKHLNLVQFLSFESKLTVPMLQVLPRTPRPRLRHHSALCQAPTRPGRGRIVTVSCLYVARRNLTIGWSWERKLTLIESAPGNSGTRKQAVSGPFWFPRTLIVTMRGSPWQIGTR